MAAIGICAISAAKARQIAGAPQNLIRVNPDMKEQAGKRRTFQISELKNVW
jgi:hypothetical protein